MVTLIVMIYSLIFLVTVGWIFTLFRSHRHFHDMTHSPAVTHHNNS
jgi:hypothetical protein